MVDRSHTKKHSYKLPDMMGQSSHIRFGINIYITHFYGVSSRHY
jgi:hypothetical protein